MAIEEIRAGQEPHVLDEDEDLINDRWAEQDRSLSFEQARQRCLQQRERHRDLALGLSHEEWTAWGVHWTSDLLGEHYDAHRVAFERALDP